jgi:hypothetical protein
VSGGGWRPPAALLATCMLAAGTFVACGDGEDDSDGGGISEADVQQAGLDFARCMREHGVDVPDPQPGRGGLSGLLADGDRADDPDFRAAEGECRKHLEDLTSEIDEGQRREFEEARLEFSRCMRDKGHDVPDPGQGGGPGGGGGLGDLDLQDPHVRRAMEACSKRLPDLGRD